MAKILYETRTTLFPRFDKDHYDVARDMLQEAIEANPDIHQKHWLVSLTTYEAGHADLTIRAYDRVFDGSPLDYDPSTNRYAFYFSPGVWACIIILLIMMGLTLFTG